MCEVYIPRALENLKRRYGNLGIEIDGFYLCVLLFADERHAELVYSLEIVKEEIEPWG